MENPRSNRRLTIDISRNINRNNDENGSDKGKNIYNPFERLSASQSPSSSSTSLIPISLDNSQNSMELLVSTIRNLQVQFGKMSSIQEQLVGQVHKMSRVILNFTRQNEHEQFDSNPIAHDQSSQSDHDCRSWFNAWITDSDALFLNPSPSFLNPFPFPFGNGEDCPFSSISSPSSTVIQIVLIVEDDQMCSCLIGNLLKYHNIDYRVAKTGYEAINATWSCDFNLILMVSFLVANSNCDNFEIFN